MNVSEYIVSYLIKNRITDIFGYQGTMIAYFIDAICKNPNICNHICYNEQAAAFAAVGYSKTIGMVGVAYATSGPGALNLISGVADAYYDSVPTLFITGQLNTNEYTNVTNLRQQGFQETDVVSIFTPITKYCVHVTSATEIAYHLEKAWFLANEGRKGPVLLDIPMNIQRTDINIDELKHFVFPEIKQDYVNEIADFIYNSLNNSSRPMLLLGNGINKTSSGREKINQLVDKLRIPAITSILGKSLINTKNKYNMGFLGAAYGHRAANIIAYRKTDLIICLGCSMNHRQTGNNSGKFASGAKIIRVDIDPIELKRKVHEDDVSFCADANSVIDELIKKENYKSFDNWNEVCREIKKTTNEFEGSLPSREPNNIVQVISRIAPEKSIAVSDVGQHQMWMAQSYDISENKKVLFSGGHGAMGFSLPAGIGAYYATDEKVIVVAGDGAFQMNIQELQWVKRENIPLTMFVLNNSSLGLIRQQQDDFFDGKRFGSTPEGGYTSPNFTKVAEAYGIKAYHISSIDEMISIKNEIIQKDYPVLIEYMIDSESKAYPKTYFGETMDNQRPYMDSTVLDELYRI